MCSGRGHRMVVPRGHLRHCRPGSGSSLPVTAPEAPRGAAPAGARGVRGGTGGSGGLGVRVALGPGGFGDPGGPAGPPLPPPGSVGSVSSLRGGSMTEAQTPILDGIGAPSDSDTELPPSGQEVVVTALWSGRRGGGRRRSPGAPAGGRHGDPAGLERGLHVVTLEEGEHAAVTAGTSLPGTAGHRPGGTRWPGARSLGWPGPTSFRTSRPGRRRQVDPGGLQAGLHSRHVHVAGSPWSPGLTGGALAR